MNDTPYLIKRFPKLAKLGWRELVSRPTPVQGMHSLAEAHNLGELWIKRDDLSNSGYGGNKPRKLEFLFGDLLDKGSSGFVTTGGIGTNHGVACAFHARSFGLRCHVVLFDQPLTDHCRKALKIMHSLGAEMHWAGNYAMTAIKTLGVMAGSRFSADPPVRLVLPGGSNALGTVGFVDAAFELADQVAAKELPEPKRIYCAVGSCGTCAGLLAGTRLAGLKTEIVGVQVAPGFVVNPKAIAHLANRTIDLMRSVDDSVPQMEFTRNDLRLLTDQYGGEYGRVTEAGQRAVDDAMEYEQLRLETTYTGKAMAGMLADLKDDSRFPSLFWNTYNSVDLSSIAEQVSCEELPTPFRRFFR